GFRQDALVDLHRLPARGVVGRAIGHSRGSRRLGSGGSLGVWMRLVGGGRFRVGIVFDDGVVGGVDELAHLFRAPSSIRRPKLERLPVTRFLLTIPLSPLSNDAPRAFAASFCKRYRIQNTSSGKAAFHFSLAVSTSGLWGDIASSKEQIAISNWLPSEIPKRSEGSL